MSSQHLLTIPCLVLEPIFLMLQRTSPELSADFIRKSAPLTGSEEEVTDQEESNDEETGESLPERIKHGDHMVDIYNSIEKDNVNPLVFFSRFSSSVFC